MLKNNLFTEFKVNILDIRERITYEIYIEIMFTYLYFKFK